MIKPKLAILDEIDSGLYVDAIKIIAEAINFARQEFGTAFLIITHYRRILDHVDPDHVHIMVKGSLVESGGNELIDEIEKNGFKKYDKTSK
jgi:Fe-S cluster assembly ATP-binding protein